MPRRSWWLVLSLLLPLGVALAESTNVVASGSAVGDGWVSRGFVIDSDVMIVEMRAEYEEGARAPAIGVAVYDASGAILTGAWSYNIQREGAVLVSVQGNKYETPGLPEVDWEDPPGLEPEDPNVITLRWTCATCADGPPNPPALSVVFFAGGGITTWSYEIQADSGFAGRSVTGTTAFSKISEDFDRLQGTHAEVGLPIAAAAWVQQNLHADIPAADPLFAVYRSSEDPTGMRADTPAGELPCPCYLTGEPGLYTFHVDRISIASPAGTPRGSEIILLGFSAPLLLPET